MKAHSLAWWRAWCERLWRQNESRWLGRTGQDHAYRRRVVVPALREALQDDAGSTLVDLGCGDGAMTALLLRALGRRRPDFILLVDRSATQLMRAEERVRPFVSDVGCVYGDVARLPLRGTVENDRRAWISVFALQELPRLAPVFARLRRVMRTSERLHAVVVAPSFAERLRRTRRAFVAGLGGARDDFRLAMRYPIADGADGAFFLPHFQRTVADYRCLARLHGLRLVHWRALTVPRTRGTERVFLPTVYGEDILTYPSSLLLTFERR